MTIFFNLFYFLAAKQKLLEGCPVNISRSNHWFIHGIFVNNCNALEELWLGNLAPFFVCRAKKNTVGLFLV
ncbi:MAG: hypothetical protein DI617_02120 [Streptococcus pyogenes]|nr:MAG: hypothetical protein DI617_02120 [Streptococcus pyogenes]